MSFRKIEKVLKEEYDHSVTFMTVKRIFEDVEILERMMKNVVVEGPVFGFECLKI